MDGKKATRMPRTQRTRIRGASSELQQCAREMRENPTPAEAVLWAALSGRKAGHLRFRFQYPVGQTILDFYCPSCRLVLEVDGGVHDRQAEEDAARTEHLETYRCRVIRFRNEEVLTDLASVLARVLEAAQEGMAPPAPNSGGARLGGEPD